MNGGQVARWGTRIICLVLMTTSVWCCARKVWAIAVAQAVGGIHIDPKGVVVNVMPADMEAVRDGIALAMQAVPGDMNQPNELRKVSLKRLEKAVAEHLSMGTPLPDEMRYLAGLQSIRYVLVYPEEQDLVLVGYGEGWTLDKRGYVVGRKTGKPVMLLDDLAVALRSARQALHGGGISCSIDPTEGGLRNLRAYAAKLSDISQVSQEQIEHTLGLQNVTVQGVGTGTHFARVLVAADYRMKRIGMKLEPSPVPGLPSYIDLMSASGRGMQSMTPRWWLTPNFQPILADPNGLAFELRGCSVKAMTEDTFFAADGSKKQAGQTSSAGQVWANRMTEKYEALSAKEPVFAQLKNCMDLAVVAALIVKHDLAAKAGCNMFSVDDPNHLMNESLESPKYVPTQANINRKGSNFIISASGGVEIKTREVLEKIEQTSSLSPVVRDAAPNANSAWWWN